MATPESEALAAAAGAEVVDAHGVRVGAVEGVYFDDDTGEPTWIGVAAGPLGLQRRVAPAEGADLDGDVVRLGVEGELVATAPEVDQDAISAADEQELEQHFGLGADVDNPNGGS